MSLTKGWQVDVPIFIGGCREQGDFGPPDVMTSYYGAPTPAWPLTRESFGSWASDAGLSEGATDAVWSLYGRAAEGRQKWAQIGTDVTLSPSGMSKDIVVKNVRTFAIATTRVLAKNSV